MELLRGENVWGGTQGKVVGRWGEGECLGRKVVEGARAGGGESLERKAEERGWMSGAPLGDRGDE